MNLISHRNERTSKLWFHDICPHQDVFFNPTNMSFLTKHDDVNNLSILSLECECCYYFSITPSDDTPDREMHHFKFHAVEPTEVSFPFSNLKNKKYSKANTDPKADLQSMLISHLSDDASTRLSPHRPSRAAARPSTPRTSSRTTCPTPRPPVPVTQRIHSQIIALPLYMVHFPGLSGFSVSYIEMVVYSRLKKKPESKQQSRCLIQVTGRSPLAAPGGLLPSGPTSAASQASSFWISGECPSRTRRHCSRLSSSQCCTGTTPIACVSSKVLFAGCAVFFSLDGFFSFVFYHQTFSQVKEG